MERLVIYLKIEKHTDLNKQRIKDAEDGNEEDADEAKKVKKDDENSKRYW